MRDFRTRASLTFVIAQFVSDGGGRRKWRSVKTFFRIFFEELFHKLFACYLYNYMQINLAPVVCISDHSFSVYLAWKVNVKVSIPWAWMPQFSVLDLNIFTFPCANGLKINALFLTVISEYKLCCTMDVLAQCFPRSWCLISFRYLGNRYHSLLGIAKQVLHSLHRYRGKI